MLSQLFEMARLDPALLLLLNMDVGEAASALGGAAAAAAQPSSAGDGAAGTWVRAG